MMQLHVVSNGPSGRGHDLTGADCVIAVNKAAALYRCTYWVFSDAAMFIEMHDRFQPSIDDGLPIAFTRQVIREHLGPVYERPELLPLFDALPKLWQDNYPHKTTIDRAKADAEWNQWSGPAALALAYLIARERGGDVAVTLAGYDMAGSDDIDGSGSRLQQGCRTNPARWPRERALTLQWVEAIEDMIGQPCRNRPSL